MVSELRRVVVRLYQDKIAGMDINSELKRALKTQERVPQFIDNLCQQLSQVRALRPDQIKDSVNSLTEVFVAAVTAKAEERTLSPLRISMINAQYRVKRQLQLDAETWVKAEEAKKKRITQILGPT